MVNRFNQCNCTNNRHLVGKVSESKDRCGSYHPRLYDPKAFNLYWSKLILAGALILSAVIGANDVEAAKGGHSRFRYCTGIDDGCTQPGKGYTVCERFLKLLNSLPTKEPPPACELKIPPGFPEFSLPKWVEMPVAENFKLLYDMEMYLVRPGGPKGWEQYYPEGYYKEWSHERPESWRRVPYEVWRADYQSRIDKGEIAPRLWRTQAVLNANGPETLIAYDSIPGGYLNACRQDMAKYGDADSGTRIFLLTRDPKLPIKAVLGLGGSNSHNLLFLDQGKALFTGIDPSTEYWFMSIHDAMPPLPPNLNEAPQYYVMTQRCAFKLNLKP